MQSDPPSFARRYSGFFDAAVVGTYVFTLTSDDGSFLGLDGNPTPLLSNKDTKSASRCGEWNPSPPPVVYWPQLRSVVYRL